MRLHILCDLHLEFGSAKIPPTEADVVVLAGDIHLGREGRKWARSRFPDKPIIYVLGNHEFYRHSLPELTETLKRETDGSHIHLLENSSVEINGHTFLGCTLWTDFQLSPDPEGAMQAAEGIMSDYSARSVGQVRPRAHHRCDASCTERSLGSSVSRKQSTQAGLRFRLGFAGRAERRPALDSRSHALQRGLRDRFNARLDESAWLSG